MAQIAFSTPHLIALGLTAGTALVLCIAGRKAEPPAKRLRRAELVLAGLMLTIFPLEVLNKFQMGYASLTNCLPLHLCDVATYIGAIALITGRALFCELIYFWGLAGTLQALITPASLEFQFPSVPFLIYFTHHGTIVIAAIFVVVGRRKYPRPRAVWRMFLWTQVYLAVAALANWTLQANYAFICEKPAASASLMDLLGPWPWYILSMELVALTTFAILYTPFFFLNRRDRKKPEVTEHQA